MHGITSILSAFILLSSSVIAGPTFARDAVQPRNQLNAIPPVDILTKFSRASAGDKFLVNNTLYEFISSHAKPSTKRQYCYTNSYQATQVPSDQHGTWLGSWEPINGGTGCWYNGRGGGNPNNCQHYSASVTTSWTASAGFDVGSADDVLRILNVQFSAGYTWGKSQTSGRSMDCCPGNSVSQIWTQSLFGWSNSQRQTCYTDSCTQHTVCGAWSGYQHADWALENQSNFGCSVGDNNVRCN